MCLPPPTNFLFLWLKSKLHFTVFGMHRNNNIFHQNEPQYLLRLSAISLLTRKICVVVNFKHTLLLLFCAFFSVSTMVLHSKAPSVIERFKQQDNPWDTSSIGSTVSSDVDPVRSKIGSKQELLDNHHKWHVVPSGGGKAREEYSNK